MTEKLIANEDCNVSAVEIEAPLSTVTGTVAITTPASTRDFAMGKGIYKGQLAVTISGCVDSSTGCTQTAPQTGNIKPSASKGLEQSDKVIREDDEGDKVVIAGTIPGPGTACTIDITPLIEAAGQDRVFSK